MKKVREVISEYSLIFGYACKENIPESVSLPDGHAYRAIKMYSQDLPGYYGILVGTAKNVYEKTLIFGNHFKFPLKFEQDFGKKFEEYLYKVEKIIDPLYVYFARFLEELKLNVEIPSEIEKYLANYPKPECESESKYYDEKELFLRANMNPKIHVVFRGLHACHYVTGDVMYGSLIQYGKKNAVKYYDYRDRIQKNLDEIIKKETSEESTISASLLIEGHSHFYGNSNMMFCGHQIDTLENLEMHGDGNYLYNDDRKEYEIHDSEAIYENEMKVLETLLKKHEYDECAWVMIYNHKLSIIDDYFENNPKDGIIISRNVFMFVPRMCHCCT